VKRERERERGDTGGERERIIKKADKMSKKREGE
jgi:hypothetical protein